MRIIAGRWRGRPIAAPDGDSTRPTSDRVREAVFDMLVSRLGADLGGADAACSTCSPGAGRSGWRRSRGESGRAVFVERDRGALEALRRPTSSHSAPSPRHGSSSATRSGSRARTRCQRALFRCCSRTLPIESMRPRWGSSLAALSDVGRADGGRHRRRTSTARAPAATGRRGSRRGRPHVRLDRGEHRAPRPRGESDRVRRALCPGHVRPGDLGAPRHHRARRAALRRGRRRGRPEPGEGRRSALRRRGARRLHQGRRRRTCLTCRCALSILSWSVLARELDAKVDHQGAACGHGLRAGVPDGSVELPARRPTSRRCSSWRYRSTCT